MTKPTDSPESPNDPVVDPAPEAPKPGAYHVQRRLKKGAYRDEFLKYVHFWLDWHYFPIAHESYASIFTTEKEAEKYIEEEKKEWPNFDYRIIELGE